MPADLAFPQPSQNPQAKIRLAHFRNISELESGVYWPKLQPYFIKPQFRRLTYRLTSRVPKGREQEQVLSTRGASGLGDLDVAYVKDRYSTVMSIGDPGLPDYCLTSVSQGALAYLAPGGKRDGDCSKTTGLIYRGLPGTRLSATDDHERIAIWIPALSLAERLAALLGEPGKDDIVFEPFIDWESCPGEGIRRSDLALGPRACIAAFFRGQRHGLPVVHGPFALHIAQFPAEQLLDAAGPTRQCPRAPYCSPCGGIHSGSRGTAHRVARSRGCSRLQRTQLAARVPAVPRHDPGGGDSQSSTRGRTKDFSFSRNAGSRSPRSPINTASPIQAVSQDSTRRRSAYLQQTTCDAILAAAHGVEGGREDPRTARGVPG